MLLGLGTVGVLLGWFSLEALRLAAAAAAAAAMDAIPGAAEEALATAVKTKA